VTKHQKRLCQKIAVLVEELELLYGIRFIRMKIETPSSSGGRKKFASIRGSHNLLSDDPPGGGWSGG